MEVDLRHDFNRIALGWEDYGEKKVSKSGASIEAIDITDPLHEIITSIKLDLKKFGVKQNLWFKETTLYRSLNKKPSLINKVKTSLKKTGFIYEKDGAQWFKSTKFNDDKDRVIEKENGQATYFASDIAYHFDKYQRGYDKIINVWGADHHGYLPRVRSAMLALKQDPKKFEVIFIQFANLLREG